MIFEIISQNTKIIINADDKEHAKSIAIQEHGIYPLKIKEIHHKASSPIWSKLFAPKVNSQELYFVFLQFKIMLDSFLPIDMCIQNIRDSIPQRRFFQESNIYNALNSILFIVKNGKTLSEGFYLHSNIFGKFAASIIEVGEKGGNLTLSFAKLCELTQNQNTQKNKIKKALIYPTIVFIAMNIAFFVILYFVIPEFELIFASFNKELPFYTQILIYLNKAVESVGYLLVVGIASSIFLGKVLYISNANIAFYFDRIILKLPFFGHLINLSEIYNFLLSLSILNQSAIPLDKSIELAQNSVKNRYIKSKIQIILDELLNGNTLSSSIARTNMVDNITLNLLKTGELSGNLNDMLNASCIRLHSILDTKINNAILFLEPFLSLFLGFLLLFLALGVFVPMWDLSSI